VRRVPWTLIGGLLLIWGLTLYLLFALPVGWPPWFTVGLIVMATVVTCVILWMRGPATRPRVKRPGWKGGP